MRFVVVLVSIFTLFALTLCAVDKEKLKSAQLQCHGEDHDLSNSQGVKKHIHCLFKKMGFLDDNGDFQEEALRKNFEKILSREKIDEIVTKCTVKKPTPEESAFSALTCIESINRPK